MWIALSIAGVVALVFTETVCIIHLDRRNRELADLLWEARKKNRATIKKLQAIKDTLNDQS